MEADGAHFILATLAAALRVPVVSITDLSPSLQQAALEAAGNTIGEIRSFGDSGRRFLTCRYHNQRSDALVLGPYRRPEDPGDDVATLDAEAEHHARDVTRLAIRALSHMVEEEQQRIQLAGQMEVTSRSVLAITSDLSITRVLHRIVDLARELSDARYGALGVPGPDGELESFFTSGLTREEEERIGHRPRGRGILGLLLREPQTVRLRDLNSHPAAVGFPAHHPPMTSLLGVPIMSRGRVLGNLYLTEKRTADEFTDSDVRQVELLARHAAVAIENARLYQERAERQDHLQQILDQLPEAVLLAEREPERITLANQQASILLGWPIDAPLSLDEFLSRNPRSNPDGSEMPVAMIPMVRSLRHGGTVNLVELQIARPDGQRLTVLVNSAPLFDHDGRVKSAITVFQDITQIKDAEQLKDDFLSLVSHELRTPLTTVQGGALMLQRDWDALDRDTQHQFLADIATESRRLGILIENMVQLANIRAGRMRMETEPVLVAPLINQAVDAVRLLSPDRPFLIDLAPRLIVEADEVRLDQVLRNLLQNAIKYSPAQSPVEVGAHRVDGMVEFSVRDHGPGIEDAELPLVFDRFHRTASTRAGNTPGMGLGLYLVRHVIQAHGGTIWVERPDDGGTRMLFTIPAPTIEDGL